MRDPTHVLAGPLVSAGMIAAELGVIARAAQDLVADLGLREITGRYRASCVMAAHPKLEGYSASLSFYGPAVV